MPTFLRTYQAFILVALPALIAPIAAAPYYGPVSQLVSSQQHKPSEVYRLGHPSPVPALGGMQLVHQDLGAHESAAPRPTYNPYYSRHSRWSAAAAKRQESSAPRTVKLFNIEPVTDAAAPTPTSQPTSTANHNHMPTETNAAQGILVTSSDTHAPSARPTEGGGWSEDKMPQPQAHHEKIAAISAILGTIIGLIILATVVKMTSNALRKRKVPGSLASRPGSEDIRWDTKSIRQPSLNAFDLDKSELTDVDLSEGNSPPPGILDPASIARFSPPPIPAPAFPPPPPPVPPVPMRYQALLSPTINLAKQNADPFRTSGTSMASSGASTSEASSAYGHKRRSSAPVSMAWSQSGPSPRTSAAAEGYWDALDVVRPESAVTTRSSRTRSMDVTRLRW